VQGIAIGGNRDQQKFAKLSKSGSCKRQRCTGAANRAGFATEEHT
jgi:hypothetical protein